MSSEKRRRPPASFDTVQTGQEIQKEKLPPPEEAPTAGTPLRSVNPAKRITPSRSRITLSDYGKRKIGNTDSNSKGDKANNDGDDGNNDDGDIDKVMHARQ